MKKNALLVFYLMFSLAGFSQKQISNFENKTEQSPNNYQFLLTFKDKVFFSAFTPETGNELWVSDGTESGTKIVKDINPGELGIYISSSAANDDYAYFLIGNKIWKTDGTSENTIEVPSPDYQNNKESIKQIASIDNKVLVISDKYSENMNSNNFYWIQSNDSLLQWENKISRFSIKDNSLFYTKKIELNYILYHYTNIKREIFSTLKYFNNIAQLQNDSTIFCSLFNSQYVNQNHDRMLFRINTKTQVIEKYTWGNHKENIPLFASDETGKLYLLKANSFENKKDSLYIYEPNIEGLKLKNKFGGENILPIVDGSNIPFISNALFLKNQLSFVSGFTIYSTRVSSFCFFDFEKQTSSLKELKLLDIDSFGLVSIAKNNDSTFKVNFPAYRFTYNPTTKFWGNQKFVSNLKTVSFQLNKKSFEISDNLYLNNETSRMPLIKSKNGFTNNYSLNIYKVEDTYKDKQLIKIVNYAKNKSEFWALDKLGLKKVASHKGFLRSDHFKVPNLSDKLFYLIKDSLKYNIYQTDGTAEGTNLYHSMQVLIDEYPVLSYNNSQIVLVGLTNLVFISKDKIITRDVGNGWAIALKESFYFKQNNDDIEIIYKIKEDGSFKSLINLLSGTTTFVFNDRFYYHSNKELFYLNNEDKAVSVAYNVDYLQKIGNFIICSDFKQNTDIYRTIDLRTNKEVVKIKTKSLVISNFDDNQILFWENASKGKDARAYFFDGKKTEEVLLGKSDIHGIEKFKNGFFIYYLVGYSKIEYYDFKLKQLYTVLENSQYLDLNININPNIEFVLASKGKVIDSSTYIVEFFTWSLKSKKLKKVELLKNEYLKFENETFISSMINFEEIQTWSFENDSLIRKEPTPKNIKDINLADIKATTVKFTPERGAEAFAIGKDFSINFEEIVKGPEGIILNNTFIFENQFYIIASTYSHGLQIWQMTDNEKIEPLTTEEDLSIKVYPNPVQDFLTIETPTMLHYSIYSSIGQEVRQGNIENKQQINIENLSQGLYIMLFNDGKKTTSKKIIKL